jgi:hypothetical protein
MTPSFFLQTQTVCYVARIGDLGTLGACRKIFGRTVPGTVFKKHGVTQFPARMKQSPRFQLLIHAMESRDISAMPERSHNWFVRTA